LTSNIFQDWVHIANEIQTAVPYSVLHAIFSNAFFNEFLSTLKSLGGVTVMLIDKNAGDKTFMCM